MGEGDLRGEHVGLRGPRRVLVEVVEPAPALPPPWGRRAVRPGRRCRGPPRAGGLQQQQAHVLVRPATAMALREVNHVTSRPRSCAAPRRHAVSTSSATWASLASWKCRWQWSSVQRIMPLILHAPAGAGGPESTGADRGDPSPLRCAPPGPEAEARPDRSMPDCSASRACRNPPVGRTRRLLVRRRLARRAPRRRGRLPTGSQRRTPPCWSAASFARRSALTLQATSYAEGGLAGYDQRCRRSLRQPHRTARTASRRLISPRPGMRVQPASGSTARTRSWQGGTRSRGRRDGCGDPIR